MKLKTLLAASMATTLALSFANAQEPPSDVTGDPYVKGVDREKLEMLKEAEAKKLVASANAYTQAELDRMAKAEGGASHFEDGAAREKREMLEEAEAKKLVASANAYTQAELDRMAKAEDGASHFADGAAPEERIQDAERQIKLHNAEFAKLKKIAGMLENGSSVQKSITGDLPLNLSICYEDFSLPLAMAAALQRENLTDAELYAKVLATVGKAEVRQETFSVIRSRSGQQVKSESITETIYPTEYESAQLSNAVTVGANSDTQKAAVQPATGPVAIARTPATPSAFETRNVGFTMEAEPILSEDGTIVDMRLNPEHVTLQGRSKWGQELSSTESPIFETQRLMLAISAKMNAPHLIGTMNPPPNSMQDHDSANRVWFAFVTVTPAK